MIAFTVYFVGKILVVIDDVGKKYSSLAHLTSLIPDNVEVAAQ